LLIRLTVMVFDMVFRRMEAQLCAVAFGDCAAGAGVILLLAASRLKSKCLIVVQMVFTRLPCRVWLWLKAYAGWDAGRFVESSEAVSLQSS
jgi:hypothetical protein